MKKILAVATGFLMLFSMKSQNNSRNNELTFNAGPSFSDIRSENVRNDRFARTRGTIAPFLNIGYTRNFNKKLGFTIGVGFTRYRNVTIYAGYFRGGELKKDLFDYAYYPVTVADYSVTRTISSLDVPVCLRLSSDNSEPLVFFADVGFRLNFITGDLSVKEGQVSYKALYPDPSYPDVFVMVENNPLYGYTNVYYHKLKTQGNNRFGYGMMANFGVSASLGDAAFLAATFTAYQGIKDMAIKQQEYYQDLMLERQSVLPSKLLLYGMSLTYGLRIY